MATTAMADIIAMLCMEALLWLITVEDNPATVLPGQFVVRCVVVMRDRHRDPKYIQAKHEARFEGNFDLDVRFAFRF